jgi:hypothetical protein
MELVETYALQVIILISHQIVALFALYLALYAPTAQAAPHANHLIYSMAHLVLVTVRQDTTIPLYQPVLIAVFPIAPIVPLQDVSIAKITIMLFIPITY